MCCYTGPHLPVPAGSLAVETEVSESGPLEAGMPGPTLTCTASETIPGLTNMPSAHWIMTGTGPVVPGNGIVINETVRNATTAITTLSFSSLLTSHAGLYHCLGTLLSPAANISNSTDPVAVTVTCEWSSLSPYYL